MRTTTQEASQLVFSGIGKIPASFEVYLIDENKARAVNLRDDSLYQFASASAISKFSVVVGRKAAVQDKLSAVALPNEFVLEAGRYWFNWEGKDEAGNLATTGVYLYRLTTSTGVTLLGKMILIR